MGLKLSKPYAYQNQSLADHIVGCLGKLEDFLRMNPNYVKVVYMRLLSAGVNVAKQGDIVEMLKLGVVVHDLGKAYKYYQDRVEGYSSGFEGHEILSAVSCYKMIGGLRDRDPLKVLLLMAVLNHHQALRESIPELLRGLSRVETSPLVKKIKDVARAGLCDSVYNLKPVLGEVGLSVESVFIRDYPEFELIFNEIGGSLDFLLRKNFDENKRLLKLYSLLMFPIILADNLDACEKRGGSVGDRLIIRELRRIVEDE
jgi:CRISPR-associated endonuclease Cas3-HD